MKIAFVDPKGIHFGLNTGIAYLVASLKRQGRVNIRVFDFNNNTEMYEERLAELSSYDVIGFSVKSVSCAEVTAMALKIKRPGNILVAGGPHITLDGMKFFRENDCFDYALCGEGEHSFTGLVDAIEGREKFENISGMIYRKKGHPVVQGTSVRITGLDAIPFPDYRDFDSIRDGHIYNYPLVSSRGCPHECIYCCVRGIMGKRWVARSVENIMAELEEVRERYASKMFNLQDDNFTFDMQRARNFCDALIRKDLAFKWSCPNGIRADRIDEALMNAMKESGCFLVAFGVESGNENEFHSIGKGEKLADIEKAVGIAHNLGMYTVGNFIIGLPQSNLNSIRESIRFARSLRFASCVFNLLIPFPGTQIWEWIQSNGRMVGDWRTASTQGKKPEIAFETDDFPMIDRMQAYEEANVKCHNYFAFMDEHDGLLKNIWNIFAMILRYDLYHLHSHIAWVMLNAGRIAARITEKNS